MPEAVIVSRDVLTKEQLEKLQPKDIILPEGDGKAVFFGEPTSEEQLAFDREQAGTNAWYDRLKRLL